MQRVDSRFDHERAAVQRRRDNERLLTQLLFSYKANPQAVVFLGYSDTADGSKTNPLAKLNRTIFPRSATRW